MINVDVSQVIWWILLIAGLGWLLYEAVNFFRRRQAAEALENDEFRENIRKAQLIDLRQKDEYKLSHILGARNMPYAELNRRMGELRYDQPIYLYEEGKMLSLRAALKLKKEGYKEIYYLKGGFDNWDGRTNSKPIY